MRILFQILRLGLFIIKTPNALFYAENDPKHKSMIDEILILYINTVTSEPFRLSHIKSTDPRSGFLQLCLKELTIS